MLFKANSNEYLANSVIVSPTNPHPGEDVKISYNGLLPQSGASCIQAHVGFGFEWQNTQDVHMTRTPAGFEATVIANNNDALCVAFKDSANNWDNNNGLNYNFNIHQ
ncbi:MAG: carbohydrate-binding protein [Veillonellales bacterium]